MNQNYIAGAWVDGASSTENRNPSDTQDMIGLYAAADEGQVDAAVSAARAAVPAMRALGLEARQTALNCIGQELMARAEELGNLLAREEEAKG